MKNFVIAIDGTAGAGKSTTAQGLARKLGFFYLDTGAMYRAFTLKIMRGGFTLDEGKLRQAMAHTNISLTKEGEHYRVFLDGQDVSLAVRSPEVNGKVSQIAALPAVREWMVQLQRRIAQGKSVVCEGRDIGTVVFPDADVKLFVQADIAVRARRRVKEFREKDQAVELKRVQENLAFRDEFDSSREHSPLTIAPGAVVIDTTDLTIAQEIDIALQEILKRLPIKREQP